MKRILRPGPAVISAGFLLRELFQPASKSNLCCEVDVWGRDEESESSNYREFANLALTVGEGASNESLDMVKFFLFTDISTVICIQRASCTYHKVNKYILNLHIIYTLTHAEQARLCGSFYVRHLGSDR